MKYFFGLVFCIALIAIVAALVVRGFNPVATKTTTPVVALDHYIKSDAVMRMTVDGPIVGESMHGAYQITVGRSAVNMQALRGYQDVVQDQTSLANNDKSYAVFLRAINFAGFSRGDTAATATQADDRGVCATGNRLIFEIIDGTKTVQRFWSTSCGGGTFRGDAHNVKALFDRQIPQEPYTKLSSTLNY